MRHMAKLGVFGASVLLLAWGLCGRAGAPAQENKAAAAGWRRPVALCLVEDGKKLVVANRHSGTLLVLNTSDLRVVGGTQVGRKIADMACQHGGKRSVVAE